MGMAGAEADVATHGEGLAVAGMAGAEADAATRCDEVGAGCR